MSKFPVTALLLLSLVSYGTGLATSWSDKDFFRYCPPSRCSKDGPEVRFPLRLEPSSLPSSCGPTGIELACSDHETILVHPVFGPCKVTSIDYRVQTCFHEYLAACILLISMSTRGDHAVCICSTLGACGIRFSFPIVGHIWKLSVSLD